MKFLTLVIAFALPASAFAFGPVQPLDKVIVKTEQFKGVSFKGVAQDLEQRLDRPLSAEEKAVLSQEMSKAQDMVLNVAYRDTSKTLLCFGGGLSAAYQITRAACYSFSTWRSYDLSTVGVGYALEAKLTFFWLHFSFDSSAYASNFDPIPGNYALVQRGLTIGGGLTWYGGDSGNKSVSGHGLNIGAGGDYATINWLLIQ